MNLVVSQNILTMEYRNSCAWRIQVINHHIKVKWLLFLSRANGIFLCIICFHKHFYSSNHVAVFCSLERVRSKKKNFPFSTFPVPTFHNSTFLHAIYVLSPFFLVNILSTFFLVNILSKMPHLFTI